jgi:hypothetical protein
MGEEGNGRGEERQSHVPHLLVCTEASQMLCQCHLVPHLPEVVGIAKFLEGLPIQVAANGGGGVMRGGVWDEGNDQHCKD